MDFTKKRAVALGLIASLLAGTSIGTSGCFGTFPFTRTIWELNRDISNSKFVQWLVFLGLAALPVYEAAIFLDLFIGNVIEFWSAGETKVEDEDLPEKREVELSGDRTAVLEYDGDKQVRMTMLRNGETEAEYTLDGRNERLEVRDGDGQLLAAARDGERGGVVVSNGHGRIVERNSPAQVDELRERIQKRGRDGALGFIVEHRPRNATVDFDERIDPYRDAARSTPGPVTTPDEAPSPTIDPLPGERSRQLGEMPRETQP